MTTSTKHNVLLLALSSMFVLPWAASQTIASALTSPSVAAASAPTPVPPLVPYAGVAFEARASPLPTPPSSAF